MLWRLWLLLAVGRLPLQHRGKDLVGAEVAAGKTLKPGQPFLLLQTERVERLVRRPRHSFRRLHVVTSAGAWRKEEVISEAVHAARVLHEVGSNSTIVVAHTSTVLLVPLSTTQRGVALL